MRTYDVILISEEMIMKGVKKIRLHMLLTQEELAERLGLTRQMISRYEHGLSMPSRNVIKQLLQLASDNNIVVTVDEFF